MNLVQIDYPTRDGRKKSWIPAESPWPLLSAVISNYQRLKHELSAAAQAVANATDELGMAARLDVESGARARLAGKSRRPVADSAERARDKLAADEREHAELGLALELAIAGLAELVEEHRAEWMAEAQEREEAARQQYADTVEQLAEARQAVGAAKVLSRWIRGFPEPGKATTVERPVVLHGRVSDAGGIPAAMLLESLRIDAGTTAAPLTLNDRLAGKHLAKPVRAEADEDEATITVAGGRVVPA